MANREILARQFRLVIQLHRHPRGVSSEKLAASLHSSRATIDRDLKALRDKVGLKITRSRRGGEVWHQLNDLPLAFVSATPLQLAALRMAREALAELDGTQLLRELDDVLALLPSQPRRHLGFEVGERRPGSQAHIVRIIDQAIAAERQVQINTRVASRGGQLETYDVDPLTLRFVDDTLYLYAWAVNRADTRTFKVARIVAAIVLDTPSTKRAHLRSERAFRNAVKAWSGEPTQVRVRLAAPIAWMVHEYPLIAGQRVLPEDDGSVVVDATVAGIREVSRWVLSWGRNAEVLEPASLRALLVAELDGALARYGPTVRSTKVSGPHASGPTKPRPSDASSRSSRSEGAHDDR